MHVKTAPTEQHVNGEHRNRVIGEHSKTSHFCGNGCAGARATSKIDVQTKQAVGNRQPQTKIESMHVCRCCSRPTERRQCQ